jgi:hypothetical protein
MADDFDCAAFPSISGGTGDYIAEHPIILERVDSPPLSADAAPCLSSLDSVDGRALVGALMSRLW